jgi:hypothetical protein
MTDIKQRIISLIKDIMKAQDQLAQQNWALYNSVPESDLSQAFKQNADVYRRIHISYGALLEEIEDME